MKANTFRRVFSLGAGAVVGLGWVTLVGTWITGAGPLGAALAFAIGAMLILPIALAYAALVGRQSGSGGEMALVAPTLGRRGAVAAGWALLVAYLAVCAFEAVSVGWLLTTLLPSFAGPPLYSILGAPVTVGALLIGFLGTMGIAGLATVRPGAVLWLQEVSTYAKLLVLGAFLLFGAVMMDPGKLTPTFAADAPMSGIVALLATTPYWFAGFNVAAQGLEEGDGRREAMLAMVVTLVVGLVIYAGLVFVTAGLVARADLDGATPAVVRAFGVAFGSPIFANLAVVAAVLGLISTWNAVATGAARLMRAMAIEGALPRVLADHSWLPPILIAALTLIALPLGRAAIGPFIGSAAVATSAVFVLVALASIRDRQVRRSIAIAALCCAVALFTVATLDALRSPEVALVLAIYVVIGAVMVLRVRHTNRSNKDMFDAFRNT